VMLCGRFYLLVRREKDMAGV